MSEAGIAVVSFDDLVDLVDVLMQSAIDKEKTRAILSAWLTRLITKDAAAATTVQNDDGTYTHTLTLRTDKLMTPPKPKPNTDRIVAG